MVDTRVFVLTERGELLLPYVDHRCIVSRLFGFFAKVVCSQFCAPVGLQSDRLVLWPFLVGVGKV